MKTNNKPKAMFWNKKFKRNAETGHICETKKLEKKLQKDSEIAEGKGGGGMVQ